MSILAITTFQPYNLKLARLLYTYRVSREQSDSDSEDSTAPKENSVSGSSTDHKKKVLKPSKRDSELLPIRVRGCSYIKMIFVEYLPECLTSLACCSVLKPNEKALYKAVEFYEKETSIVKMIRQLRTNTQAIKLLMPAHKLKRIR